MKTLLAICVLVLTSCSNGNGNEPLNVDSSNVITDSAALMDADTTTVLGANHIGEGQMRTDTPINGPNTAH